MYNYHLCHHSYHNYYYHHLLSSSSSSFSSSPLPSSSSLGVGMLDDRHSSKNSPEVGMIVCKVGGPAYRIGEWRKWGDDDIGAFE
jgi:hypothetical protein